MQFFNHDNKEAVLNRSSWSPRYAWHTMRRPSGTCLHRQVAWDPRHTAEDDRAGGCYPTALPKTNSPLSTPFHQAKRGHSLKKSVERLIPCNNLGFLFPVLLFFLEMFQKLSKEFMKRGLLFIGRNHFWSSIIRLSQHDTNFKKIRHIYQEWLLLSEKYFIFSSISHKKKASLQEAF